MQMIFKTIELGESNKRYKNIKIGKRTKNRTQSTLVLEGRGAKDKKGDQEGVIDKIRRNFLNVICCKLKYVKEEGVIKLCQTYSWDT